MNAADRTDFAKLAEQIEALTAKAAALEKLEEVTPALVELARIQPTLSDLAEGYKAAGWFGRFIKWIGALAGAVLAVVAIWTLYFGDGKP